MNVQERARQAVLLLRRQKTAILAMEIGHLPDFGVHLGKALFGGRKFTVSPQFEQHAPWTLGVRAGFPVNYEFVTPTQKNILDGVVLGQLTCGALQRDEAPPQEYKQLSQPRFLSPLNGL